MNGPTEIVPGVFGLGTEVVNWYLVVADDGVTAVDAGLSGFGKTLAADLQRIGRTPADVTALVLTHADGDHTGLAPKLKAAGARVLVHEADERALRKAGPKKGDASPRHILANVWRPDVARVFGHLLRQGAKPGKVEGAETFADGAVLDVPGKPRAIHTPGHTAGHCVLHFEDHGVLFVGDALTTHPLITGGPPVSLMYRFLNEDNAQSLASLDAIANVDAEVLLPGHGEPWRRSAREAAEQARAAAG